MDFKTTFIHGLLKETVYMTQPEGFDNGNMDQVCLLLKSLYGLKPAPLQWNIRFDEFIKFIGYKQSRYDPCVYFNNQIYLLLYVDDMLLIGKNKGEIEDLKRKLNEEFEMKNLGSAKKILGINIFRNRPNTIFLSQKDYLEKVLSRFGMQHAKSVSSPLAHLIKLSKEQAPKTETERAEMDTIPYASAVGSLMYAMVCS